MSTATAGRARAHPAALVRAVPAWLWLVGIVVLSALLRYGLGRRMVAPWIMIDELVYSELAKSFAESGSFLIRGEPAGGAYGIVYPILISPAYALFGAVPDAYAAAKTINAIVISLAAVPAYFLARRVLSPYLALAAAALSVAVPSLLYAGMLLTVNAFYPVFLCAALALLLAVERPTPLRVVILLGVAGLAFATRAQALVLVPALLLAPLLLLLFQRRGWRALADFRWLYGIPAAAGVALLALQAVRGRSPLDLLGAYRVTGEESYDLGEVARWLFRHVAELDLSLAVVPFAAFLLLLAIVRRLEDRDQAFLAVATALSVCVLIQVAAFASKHALRVEERNMFYLAPFFLIALLLWIERGAPRPEPHAAIAAGIAAVLPAFLPFSSLITTSAVSDTFGLLPWWTVHEWGIPLDRLWLVVLAACAAAGAAFLLVPRRYALVLPALVFLFFAVTTQPVEERLRTASIGSLFQGITVPERDWVDRAVGSDAEVAAVWTGALDPLTVLQNEFFSRSIGSVYTTAGPVPGGLAQTPLALDPPTGLYLDPEGRRVEAAYVLADDSLPLIGDAVARDERKGLTVVATAGPIRARSALVGAYPDGWSGPQVTWTRYGCTGGSVAVELESDPRLFDGPQRVVARVGGEAVARGVIPRAGATTLVVPLRAEGDRCVVRFAVTPTAVPGPTDRRRLGTHFRRFDYRP